MGTSRREVFICSQCTGEVQAGDEYCIHCGTILPDYVLFCRKHVHTEASGVCIICHQPYCLGCASWINNGYLCNRHLLYEIYERMARVYGINDEIIANHIGECLRDSGLHPMVVHSKSCSLYTGGLGIGVLQEQVSPRGIDPSNEFKVMVPCHEVLLAEQTLRDLEFLPQPKRAG